MLGVRCTGKNRNMLPAVINQLSVYDVCTSREKRTKFGVIMRIYVMICPFAVVGLPGHTQFYHTIVEYFRMYVWHFFKLFHDNLNFILSIHFAFDEYTRHRWILATQFKWAFSKEAETVNWLSERIIMKGLLGACCS